MAASPEQPLLRAERIMNNRAVRAVARLAAKFAGGSVLTLLAACGLAYGDVATQDSPTPTAYELDCTYHPGDVVPISTLGMRTGTGGQDSTAYYETPTTLIVNGQQQATIFTHYYDVELPGDKTYHSNTHAGQVLLHLGRAELVAGIPATYTRDDKPGSYVDARQWITFQCEQPSPN